MTERSVYWFRLPDDETILMKLKLAELKCYLVVMRDIQRAKNQGLISVRQVARHSGISLNHVHEALSSLVEKGYLLCEKRPGAIAKYSLPFNWKKQDRSPTGEQFDPTDCTPTGEQPAPDSNANDRSLRGEPMLGTKERAEADCTPVGEHHCTPLGEQNCSPVGEQHLDYSESSESAFSGFVPVGKAHQADCGHSSQKARTAARPPCDASSNTKTSRNAENPEHPGTSREFDAAPPRSCGTPWSATELAKVRSRITAFFGQEPSERLELSVMLRVRGATADAVVAVLDEKYADRRYRPGGRYAPHSENWFLEVLSNALCGQHFPEALAAPQALSNAQKRFNAAAIEAIEVPGQDQTSATAIPGGRCSRCAGLGRILEYLRGDLSKPVAAYCDCPMGVDLSRAEAKLKAKREDRSNVAKKVSA